MSILLIEFVCTVLSHSSVTFTYKLETERQKWRNWNKLYHFVLLLSGFVSALSAEQRWSIVTVTNIILYCDQQMHNYLTNFHTHTCFDTIVSSSGSF